MNLKVKELNQKFMEEINKDEKIIAVLVFGSYSRGEHYRDIDICLVLDKKYSNSEIFDIRLKYASIASSKFDIQVFQQLPLYIRIRILKEGKAIILKNEDLLYDIAFLTIKEFNLFERYYNRYLEMIKDG